MGETRTITLGDREFAVPMFPLRVNRKAYPLCRKLTNGAIVEQAVAAGGALACTDEQMEDLASLCFMAANAADPLLSEEQFDELLITPPQMLDAFFTIRFQTGGWTPVKVGGDQQPPGEVQGA